MVYAIVSELILNQCHCYPVTGKLWDAENGEDVNLVEPGFNSGWKTVMGPIASNIGVSESNLVNIPGSQYADPVFTGQNQ